MLSRISSWDEETRSNNFISKSPLDEIPLAISSASCLVSVSYTHLANQLTRSAFPAMQDTATKILQCHRAKEVDESLMSIKDIITLID